MQTRFEKILQNLEKNSIKSTPEILQRAFNFLQSQEPTMSEQEKQELILKPLDVAHNYSLQAITPELVAVFMLAPISRKNQQIEQEINKLFDKKFTQILKAYNLAETNLKTKIDDRCSFAHTLNTTLQIDPLNLGYEVICASLLKHVPEFSNITIDEIKNEFGDDIAEIIINVNKLKSLRSLPHKANTIDLQQMFLSLSKDIRVILIKMCSLIDMLINLHEIKESHRTRIATEAMHIYAPIADILGIWRIKWQLEDYSFKHLNPTEYDKISQRFNVDEKKNREKYIEKTKQVIFKKAQEQGIECQLDGRFKHFYSIYKKMNNYQKDFNEVYDVFALRVIVNNIEDCYRMLGLIHQTWKPKSERIKDYIAAPKKNSYQSLHTTVYGINGRMTEFQIRTKEMDDSAKFGVASHWLYKHNNPKLPKWVNHFLSYASQNPLEQINSEFLFDQIFVYTPKRDIISLPKGSNAIDFAYHIHTDLGHKFNGVKINGQLANEWQKLKNEDVVEIITNPKQSLPKAEWLKMVKSPLAIKVIKTALNQDDEPKRPALM
ncbi:hypothetical protein A2223_01795 [Candidatus Falkowbacteria bacterium RIFOXYA2_FULL_35_8]|uniref:TGS domain-containing protein n=1 Tax=Candidatus Falkowbacteria bacterium RIFOXYC2_FULL_36_12 TaxID=1798002 RepID=A0A1F5SYZ8_9BACT|nr:MAG: hypothetical protein A2300_00240 [Candidatus Falkowbacteria bacterium RIFOXYB2_FULL_35_7]OGF31889.1 MAG: hypothetical protein A2478_05405 [Candidatus Falkowbacteria bacterium RIFOXYC2_FULL_36_12]OGF33994.1 MAG: hypothetical protein A2223_01795 [Candidatus Falkowbacteria bacterium RIFOXYA2_FULL_35_8]